MCDSGSVHSEGATRVGATALLSLSARLMRIRSASSNSVSALPRPRVVGALRPLVMYQNRHNTAADPESLHFEACMRAKANDPELAHNLAFRPGTDMSVAWATSRR